jgi:hypothetical protein
MLAIFKPDFNLNHNKQLLNYAFLIGFGGYSSPGAGNAIIKTIRTKMFNAKRRSGGLT